MPSRAIHVVTNARISFFVYGWVIFHCVYRPHLLYSFIHWWKQLRLLLILALVNNAAMNIVVHVSFQMSVFIFFGKIPRSGTAGSYSGSVLIFEELPYCFPQWVHHFTFLMIVHKSSVFSTSLPMLVISYLFGNSHSDRCEVIAHCGF